MHFFCIFFVNSQKFNYLCALLVLCPVIIECVIVSNTATSLDVISRIV